MSWPAEQYERDASGIAGACLALLTREDEWIHRRVETIELQRRELARRQVTVEFTLPLETRDSLRIGDEGPWCVPLAVLRKKPLRNFDLREDGAAIPILERTQNGRIAAELLRTAAALALDLGDVDDALQNRLAAIAHASAELGVTHVEAIVRAGLADHSIQTVLEDETASYFLATLAENYLLIGLLREPGQRRILKYSYDDPLEFRFGREGRGSRIAQVMGWKPVLIDVPVPAALRGPSYHAEVVIPDELRIDALIIDGQTEGRLSTHVDFEVDRASLHAPDVPAESEPLLVAAVYPERAGMAATAVSVALVTASLLTVGATVADLDSATVGSTAAVILAGSALFAGVVARGDEHRLVKDVFVGARALLAVVGLSALAAAASVAFGASEAGRATVWAISAGVSWLAALSLGVTWSRAAPLRRSPELVDTAGEQG